ncbi:MAG: L,D-transpeptidase [Bacteroidetes bacterium]|nr:L,D-transpeptidase [Bacteroidota bacterium]
MKTAFLHCISIIMLPAFFLSFHSTSPITTRAPKKRLNSHKENPYYIIISKKTYELKVYDDEGWYATYPCVFGSNDLRDKFMEGDKRTPEGKFKVVLKKNNAKWKFEMLLDYPNLESTQKFNERKARGEVPRNAKIGGGIAIHATRPQEEWTVDYFQNWTDGCISLKYSEAEDLYSYIPVGTPVTILP